jgi:hypothetical protein
MCLEDSLKAPLSQWMSRDSLNMTPRFLLGRRRKQSRSGNSGFWQAFDIERRLGASASTFLCDRGSRIHATDG